MSVDGMSTRSAIWGQERIKDYQRPDSCDNCHTRWKVIKLRAANQDEIISSQNKKKKYDITSLTAKCNEMLKSEILSNSNKNYKKTESNLGLDKSTNANYERVVPLSNYRPVMKSISWGVKKHVPYSTEYNSESSQHPMTSESDVISYIKPTDNYY